MLEETDSPSPPAPAKYSRYRSVRQQAEASKSPPRLPEPKSKDAPVSRSMSRYRRPMSVVPKNDAISPQSLPPVPGIPRALDLASPVRRVTEPVSNSQRQQRPAGSDRYGVRQGSRPRETETERLQRKARELRTQEEQKRKDEQEQKSKEEHTMVDAEAKQARLAEEMLAEQKRKDLERLKAELDAAPPPLPMPSGTNPREKLGFFSRKRAATKVTSPPSTATDSRTSEETTKRSQDAPPRGVEHGGVPGPTSEPRVKSQDLPSRAIEHGGGGIVPGTDAPMSAVNAGERRVLIRCKQSSINLPITPDTTPVDLIYSAANIMTQDIIPSTAVLLESYTQLGLERKIRRYEHIRDIMNSWDRDTQNALILQTSDSPKSDLDLNASSVQRDAPPSVSIHLWHSQKPGKWSKRYITLLSTGQIYIAKKPGAKTSDKDVANICHLSDFDIYTPTPQQLRKHLKPPRKYCHAIKSQQKTTMFLSTTNFVHFFSTDDETLAAQWYDAVQNWRSWYLVNKMGEGKKAKGRMVAELSTRASGKPGAKDGPTHKVRVSVDENPYTIGSFTPLLDLDRFGASAEPEYESEEENRPRQIPFHLRNSISLSPLPSRRESKRHPPPVSYRLPPDAEEEFASSGLLGRTYSQRQRAQKEREAAQSSQPFLDGPSLLNGPMAPPTSAHHRSLSMKSTKGKRPETSSGPQLPKPLLDFTPQFKEAPQWDKAGKGHGVAPPMGVPLVDVATTPDNPLADIPKTTLLRRETTSARPQTSAARGERAFVKGGLISGI